MASVQRDLENRVKGGATTEEIILAGTRRPSGIVPAMQPCTTFNRPVAPHAISAHHTLGGPPGSAPQHPCRPGTSTTQEETHGFEASAPLPGIHGEVVSSYPPPASALTGGEPGRDHPRYRNHTVNRKMLSALFSVPSSGTHPLASYIRTMRINTVNGAADACGR
jgi:hypothetical protein